MKTSHKINRITMYASILFCFMATTLTGCASIILSESNGEFKENHQRIVEFDPSSAQANYLGKNNGNYIFEIPDSKNRKIIFNLPAKQNEAVEIKLDNSDKSTITGKTALFHFTTRRSSYEKNSEVERSFCNSSQPLDSEADFPQHVYILTEKDKTRFSYTCKEGKFSSEIDKSIEAGIKCNRDHNEKNCHGLSFGDSFTWGLRNAGYALTVPLDCASIPIVLPLGIVFVSTYCGPFGCP